MNLKELFTNHVAKNLMKILFHNRLTIVLEYPSYEIIMRSKDLFPNIELVGKKPREVDNPIAKISPEIREATLPFRIKGITTNWLILIKQSEFSELELYKMTDIPIMHGGILVGIMISFELMSLENLYLFNYLMSDNKVSSSPSSKYELSILEKEILFMAALGKSSKETANTLSAIGIREISYNTVKSIISQRIYKKLGVNTISDAVNFGVGSNEIHKIPESLLIAKLKDYYLISQENQHIEI